MPSTNHYKLTSIGNTIVDLEFRVDESTLQELGIEKGHMSLIDLPKKNELLEKLGTPIHTCSGGSTANSTFIASKLNTQTFHLGVIGTDNLGLFTKKDYDDHGIHHCFQNTITPGDTASCLVLITPDGERTMLTYLGVSADFKPTLPYEAIISHSDALFIEGYLIANPDVFHLLLNTLIPLAKTHQTKLALTLSDAGLVQAFESSFNQLIDTGIDWLFANANEAAAITKTTHLNDQAKWFTATETVVTDSEKGAYVIANHAIHHYPTTALTPIDTTGAGDAFAGTYLAERLNGQSIETAANHANQMAGIVISNVGARPAAILDACKNVSTRQ